jgi:hypothetical protein
MKTHGLTIKLKAKKPKNARNCESWASEFRGQYLALRFHFYLQPDQRRTRADKTCSGITELESTMQPLASRDEPNALAPRGCR